MAEEFEVHGPHDHELHHAAEAGHSGGSFSGRIAVVTAILATAGALFSYEGGSTLAEAALSKNNAAISKTEAADQWAFYQAKGTKQTIAELAAVIASEDKRAGYAKEAARYSKEKDDIKVQADKFEKESANFDRLSEEQMHTHHRWAFATTMLQISIALAAIALLTRRRWLEYGVYGVASIGVAIGIIALVH
ncbi:MAG TPA: DUF4337 domain-containing protein [Rhodocyclaceae bacterium]|nr:DUF4337 domain-containing protein [Rhodocyclaceae bacterium]